MKRLIIGNSREDMTVFSDQNDIIAYAYISTCFGAIRMSMQETVLEPEDAHNLATGLTVLAAELQAKRNREAGG